MTNTVRAVVTPKLGLYRSGPLVSRWADTLRREKCLYLALLPSGRFVRTMAPADGFDFAAYADAATAACTSPRGFGSRARCSSTGGPWK